MNETAFYVSLLQDLASLQTQTKNVVSSEEMVYVNKKINRIQYLIEIQIQEVKAHESR